MGSGLFKTHQQGDKVRIFGDGLDAEITYKKISGPRKNRRVDLEINGIEGMDVLELDDNEPVAISKERGVYIRIGGYFTEDKEVRMHYIVDKKYIIEFL